MKGQFVKLKTRELLICMLDICYLSHIFSLSLWVSFLCGALRLWAWKRRLQGVHYVLNHLFIRKTYHTDRQAKSNSNVTIKVKKERSNF